MRKILKYSLNGLGYTSFTTYACAKPLSVGWQDGLKIWMDVDVVRGILKYEFEVFGTGWEIPSDFEGVFIGTVQGSDGYVYHVFQK